MPDVEPTANELIRFQIEKDRVAGHTRSETSETYNALCALGNPGRRAAVINKWKQKQITTSEGAQ
jgi:hypothetical protein